jgi:hypothetical protein
MQGSYNYAPGTLVNTNTIEGFKNLDKKAAFNQVAQTVHIVVTLNIYGFKNALDMERH